VSGLHRHRAVGLPVLLRRGDDQPAVLVALEGRQAMAIELGQCQGRFSTGERCANEARYFTTDSLFMCGVCDLRSGDAKRSIRASDLPIIFSNLLFEIARGSSKFEYAAAIELRERAMRDSDPVRAAREAFNEIRRVLGWPLI
jgi:hypothetical protein